MPTDLLLLHGALGDREQLAALASRLSDTHRVHIIEMAGHGATPLGGRVFRIEGFSEQVAAYLDTAGVPAAAIFGYSMGGYVGLHLAAALPDRATRVATLATKLAWSAESAAREAALLDPSVMRAKVPRFAEALERRHTAEGWERVLAMTADLMRALGDRPLLSTDVLSGIAHPVRVMVGDRDVTVSVAESAAAASTLARGELEVLPRTAHPFEKAPLDRLVRSLAEFFGG